MNDHERIIKAVELLLQTLLAEQRKTIFDLYCYHCGSDDPMCWCMNDE